MENIFDDDRSSRWEYFSEYLPTRIRVDAILYKVADICNHGRQIFGLFVRAGGLKLTMTSRKFRNDKRSRNMEGETRGGHGTAATTSTTALCISEKGR